MTRHTPSRLYTSLADGSGRAVVKRPADPWVSVLAVSCRLTKPGTSRNASIARSTTARSDGCSLCGNPSTLVGGPPELACGNPSPLVGVHASYPRVPPRSYHDPLAPPLTRSVSLCHRLSLDTARPPPSTATAPTPCRKEGPGPPEVPAPLEPRGRGADEADGRLGRTRRLPKRHRRHAHPYRGETIVKREGAQLPVSQALFPRCL